MSAQYKSSSYWISQIGFSALMVIASPILAVVLVKFSPEEPGRALIMILIGIAFLICLICLIRAYRRMSKTQRAIYAWALTQHSVNPTTMNLGGDIATMGIASRAKDGSLSRDELLGLQALNPAHPYPGVLPELPTRSSRPTAD